MRVLAQNYASGELELLEVPEPSLQPRHILVGTAASLVSLGTEKAMIDMARKSLLGKALSRPDWVKQVIDKIKTEGIAEAYRQSKARLDMPIPLGYSSAGVVIGVGSDVHGFSIGDRVACSGSGYASHAEVVSIPVGLCARIHANVTFEEAAYVALGAIALEAVRMAKVEIGSRAAVIGLGLLGQLAVQVLCACGCHVLGVDVAAAKCDLAAAHGAEKTAVSGRDDVPGIARELTGGQGLDAAIIMAAARGNEPIDLAAETLRERGRLVATGLVGLQIPRKPFYEKELEFVVSRAWGPGVCGGGGDPTDRQFRFPYPRWTAQENLAEFLCMVSDGRVRTEKLTTHRYPFEKALEAYGMLLRGTDDAIGVLLNYRQPEPGKDSLLRKVVCRKSKTSSVSGDIGVGLIGAGVFARGTLLPVLRKLGGVRLVGVATAGGVSASHVADKYGFEYCTTDCAALFNDDRINAVLILTRHGSHSKFVVEALRSGKAVFVEKPLAVTAEQLAQVIAAYGEAPAPYLLVDFNRRFSRAAIQARRFIGGGASVLVNVRCNAGGVPADSWVNDPEDGGGRIIGEVCHFIDLVQYLTGGRPKQVFAACASSRENVAISLQMDNNAACTILYAGNGDKSFPRERVEVFAHGGVFVIDNFMSTEVVTGGRRKRRRSFSIDRGHAGGLKAFFDNLRQGKGAPVPFAEHVAATLTTFAVEKSLSQGECVDCSSLELPGHRGKEGGG